MPACRAVRSTRSTSVFNDPHLAQRAFFADAPHATLGPVRQIGSPMRFSETPVRIERAGPVLGGDSAGVLRALGVGDDELAQLARDGVTVLGMIRVERRERGIAWVVVDRPQARNAMTFAMWERLREVAGELDADPSVRVVVLTGAGSEAFVAGTDIAEFRAFRSADDGVAYEQRINAVIDALEAIRVPTIAAIAGACTGGGVSVAATCDLRIGAPNARIGVPIARTLGNCISLRNFARVAGIVGAGRGEDAAAHRQAAGRAEDAPACGFLTELGRATTRCTRARRTVAEELGALAPLTLRATKEMARRLRRRGPLPDDEDLIRLCYGSRDFREGLTAFLDKRRPQWTGRLTARVSRAAVIAVLAAPGTKYSPRKHLNVGDQHDARAAG